MDEVHCLGECARVFSDSNESVHFYISEHKSRAGGKEREQKKKKNSHASPWTGHWNSAMQRLRVSRLEGLIIFEGHALC